MDCKCYECHFSRESDKCAVFSRLWCAAIMQAAWLSFVQAFLSLGPLYDVSADTIVFSSSTLSSAGSVSRQLVRCCECSVSEALHWGQVHSVIVPSKNWFSGSLWVGGRFVWPENMHLWPRNLNLKISPPLDTNSWRPYQKGQAATALMWMAV